MGKVIAICNQKGGVGKTTTAIATAATLSQSGYKVLAIDCDDGNASLTKNLGYDPAELKTTLTDLLMFQSLGRDIDVLLPEAILHQAEGFDIIPADNTLAGMANYLANAQENIKNKTLSNVLAKIKSNYDYIVIDTAPTLNVVFINALAATDDVVIVTQSQAAAEAAIGELITTIIQVKERVNPNIVIKGLLITMLDNRTKYEKNKSDYIDSTYSDLGMKVFDSKIPRAIAAAKCVDAKQSIIAYEPKGTVAQAYKEFVTSLIGE